MYKKIQSLAYILLTTLLFILAFKNYHTLTPSIIEISLLFVKNVFPFLFISFFLNNLLIEFNLPYYVYKLFHNIYIYIFIMSMISGAPSNAIIIKSFLEKKEINHNDASYLLAFTTFNSPLFLYHYFHLIFNNYRLSITLFLIIYTQNIILFIVFRKKLSKNNAYIKKNNHTFFSSITTSINKSTTSIINIYGTIIIFQLISDLTLPKDFILRGLIEITQGLNIISQINISLKIKELLTLVILSFAGLSIHIQICSVLQEYHINYKYFYLSRIILIMMSLGFIIISLA